jgi:hypothetical protein
VADLSDNWGRERTGEYHRGVESSIAMSWDSDDESTEMSWDSTKEPMPMSWDPQPPTRVDAAVHKLADELAHAAHGAGQIATDMRRTHAERRHDSYDDADGM